MDRILDLARTHGTHVVFLYTTRYGGPAQPPPVQTASLSDVPDHIDVVDVFRDPAAVPEIAREAVEVGAGALWLQFGVISAEGARIARDGRLAVVMDRCLKVEHARLLGRMHWMGFDTGVIAGSRR